MISSEQRCFRVLTFFSADSENMKKISAVQNYKFQRCFRAELCCFRKNQLWISAFHNYKFQSWTALFQKESALNQRFSELQISALFQSWTTLFQKESALNQRCSALIFLAMKHWVFSTEQRWFSPNLLWISSYIKTCRWDYQIVITYQKWWKRLTWSFK